MANKMFEQNIEWENLWDPPGLQGYSQEACGTKWQEQQNTESPFP